MFSRIRSALGFSTLFAATALSASAPASASAPPAPVVCSGGAVATASDARRFANCDIVRGDLEIAGTRLQNLRAFQRVRRVEGELVIADNDWLADLSGLERLSAAAKISIRNNRALDGIEGLAGLRQLRALEIAGNPRLHDLDGLERLERLDALTLSHTGLRSTRGLEGLREVGNLVVSHNRFLIALGGLKHVSRARSVIIEKNPRLCAGLGLFPALVEVRQGLVLNKNGGLSKSDVLALLSRTKTGEQLTALPRL